MLIYEKSLSRLLKDYNPKAGRPVPTELLYAANTVTAAEFEQIKAEAEAISRRNWARYQDAQRAEAYAATLSERFS